MFIKALFFHETSPGNTEFFSGPSFPVFGLNTGKYGPEKTPYLGTFHAVKNFKKSSYLEDSLKNTSWKLLHLSNHYHHYQWIYHCVKYARIGVLCDSYISLKGKMRFRKNWYSGLFYAMHFFSPVLITFSPLLKFQLRPIRIISFQNEIAWNSKNFTKCIYCDNASITFRFSITKDREKDA